MTKKIRFFTGGKRGSGAPDGKRDGKPLFTDIYIQGCDNVSEKTIPILIFKYYNQWTILKYWQPIDLLLALKQKLNAYINAAITLRNYCGIPSLPYNSI